MRAQRCKEAKAEGKGQEGARAGCKGMKEQGQKSADSAYENNLARADEVKNPLPGSRRSTARKMFPSRDFH